MILLTDPAQPRRRLWDEPLEPRDLRRAGEEGCRHGPLPVDGLLPAPGSQRVPDRRPSLRAHDDAAALARVADRPPGRSLAQAMAATTSSIWCSGDHKNPEYRIADDVRIATEVAGRFRQRRHHGVPVGGDLHRGAVDHRRRADRSASAASRSTFPAFWWSRRCSTPCWPAASMVLIGRRFVTVSEKKNQAEAEFRYVLTRLRENGESIALIQGEEEERAGVDRSLRRCCGAGARSAVQTMKTTIVSQTSGYIAPVLPIILCAPKFLDGSMSLGEVMQAASAFTIVQGAFNWLVDNYPRLADWTASARRVASLWSRSMRWSTPRAAKGSAASSAANDGDGARRCACTTSRSRSTTAPRWWTTPTSRSRRASACWSPANPAPARARWCAPSPACGRGASGEIEVEKGAKLFLLPQRALRPDRHAAPRRDLSRCRR